MQLRLGSISAIAAIATLSSGVHAQSPPERVSASTNPNPIHEAFCAGSGVPGRGLEPAPHAHARFTVLEDGSVLTRPNEPLTISFEGAHVTAARVALLGAHARTIVRCGRVTAGTVYNLGMPDPWQRLEIEVFDDLRQTQSDDSRRRAAEAVAQTQKKKQEKASYRSIQTHYDALLTRQRRVTLTNLQNEPLNPATLDKRILELNALLSWEQLAKDAGVECAIDARSDDDARCAAVRALSRRLHSATEDLAEARAGKDKHARYMSALQKGTNALSTPVNDGTEVLTAKRYCELRAELAWLEPSNFLQFAKRTTVVVPGTAPVHRVRYGTGTHTLYHANSSEPIALLVNAVPKETALRVTTRYSAPPQGSVEALAKLAVGIVLQAAKVAPFSTNEIGPQCNDQELRMPADVPGYAALEARTVLLMPERDKVTEVTICELDKDGKCATEGDAPGVRNVVAIHPRDRARFTVLLDFGVHTGIGLESAEEAYTRATFEATGGIIGPDQRFVLRREHDLRDRLVVSVIPAARWRGWMIGVGPGIVDLRGEPAFDQWNTRVGVGLSKSFFLTAGFGIRFAKEPRHLAYDDEISVPRAAVGQEPSSPTIAEKTVPSVVFGIGLGFDLAVLGDGAAGFVESLGGKPSSSSKKE
jgi:hypothetical protein